MPTSKKTSLQRAGDAGYELCIRRFHWFHLPSEWPALVMDNEEKVCYNKLFAILNKCFYTREPNIVSQSKAVAGFRTKLISTAK